MKVVTLKNIPEVPAPGAAETDGWIFRARARDALNRSGGVAIPRMAGTTLSAFFGIWCPAGRPRSGAEVEGVGFAGDDHGRRKPYPL